MSELTELQQQTKILRQILKILMYGPIADLENQKEVTVK